MNGKLTSILWAVARLFSRSLRKLKKRLFHPIVFQTPVLFPFLNLWRIVFFRLSFSMNRFKHFSQAPIQVRSKWWFSLYEGYPLLPDIVLPSRDEILEQCRSIREVVGCWPISFSHPRGFRQYGRTSRPDSETFQAEIIPGLPYSFDAEEEYLATYQKARFALTNKKGGWDCFRHLEILASGALPVMPDARSIPANTMVHYPKRFLQDLADELPSIRGITAESSNRLRDFLVSNLSSISMAEYVLGSAGVSPARRILFVDFSLAEKVDYLSAFTLIGLKHLRGNDVVSATKIPYIYDDYSGITSSLYGRGFGYSRSVDRMLAGSDLAPGEFRPEAIADQFDYLVIGSITRNQSIARNLLRSFDPQKTIWLHGEDRGPNSQEIEEITSTGVELFVRELR